MTTRIWIAAIALLAAGWPGLAAPRKAPREAWRYASWPMLASPGQRLTLCVANLGTGTVDVTLAFLNVRTGAEVAGRTLQLPPMGATGTPLDPCLSTTAPAPAAEGPLLLGTITVLPRGFWKERPAVISSLQLLTPAAAGRPETVQYMPLFVPGASRTEEVVMMPAPMY